MPSASFDKHRSASSSNPNRPRDKDDSSKRDRSTINRLAMYKGGKHTRDKEGNITGGEYLARDKSGNEKITAVTGRIQPDRRWFGNTRVVGAKELDTFREAMAARMHDPYSVVLRAKTLPTGLLTDAKTAGRANLLTAESYASTYGPKAQRKRMKLAAGDMSELVNTATAASAEYAPDGDRDAAANLAVAEEGRALNNATIFEKGQSKRIWGELYMVLDCRFVVV